MALAASHPVDYDDLGFGVNLAPTPAASNSGQEYDPGMFDHYADQPTLDYAEPVPGEVARHKRQLGAGINFQQELFATLHDYIRPERDTDSNDTDVKVPLHGLVHAVETTLLNSASKIKTAPNATQSSTTEVPQANEDDRHERSIEVESSAKFDDVDEYMDKDLKLDITGFGDADERGRNLGLLSPIAFSPSIQDRNARSTSTDATPTIADESTDATEAADATHEPIHQTNITVIKSTNSTKVVPVGDTLHVQHQHIQQSIFHSNLAILPTIAPSILDVPLPVKAKDADDGEDEVSSNSSTSTDNKVEVTTEDREAIKAELVKKAQKLKEQVAEVEAEPIILSQGV